MHNSYKVDTSRDLPRPSAELSMVVILLKSTTLPIITLCKLINVGTSTAEDIKLCGVSFGDHASNDSVNTLSCPAWLHHVKVQRENIQQGGTRDPHQGRWATCLRV